MVGVGVMGATDTAGCISRITVIRTAVTPVVTSIVPKAHGWIRSRPVTNLVDQSIRHRVCLFYGWECGVCVRGAAVVVCLSWENWIVLGAFV